MDATTQTDLGGRVVAVEGLLGRLLGLPTPPQPLGEDHNQMRSVALQADGIPIGFTTYRPADITGLRPIWYEFANNVGDVDAPPIGVPMGPRHFNVPTGS